MKLTRSIPATVRRPGNPAEAAFSAGYTGKTNSYARQFPDAFKAGKKAAREAAEPADKKLSH